MQSGYITLPNQEVIFYEETGTEYLQKAPSLLFIHGNFSNSEWWYDTIEGLKHLKVHLIAVDQRGFGKSTYKTPCNRFLSWAEDMKEFCKIRGITQCIANGWSFGGGVAMKLAEIAPQLVVKIILTCSVSYQGLKLTYNGKPCITREEILQNPKTIFMLDMLKSGDLQKMMSVYELMLFTYSKNYPIQKKQRMAKASFEQRCYVQLLECLANSDIQIQKIKAKCLMIHGKYDMVVVLDSVKSTGEYFRNFLVWENNAHMIPIENPQGYEAQIIKFINSQ